MLPLSSDATTTTFMPHMEAEAGLVPEGRVTIVVRQSRGDRETGSMEKDEGNRRVEGRKEARGMKKGSESGVDGK